MSGAPEPSIEDLLERFLAGQRARLAPRTYRNYEYVVELLSRCLNGYAPNSLTGLDHKRWQKAFEAGDEDAFCRLFGAGHIVDNMGEFLGYFIVRKVSAGQELIAAAGTVTKKLARWLHDNGYIGEADYDEANERGAEAARDLPRAEKLGRLLYELALEGPEVAPDTIPDKDWVEGHLQIARVQPGVLWFDGGVGPITVPRTASALAQLGWRVTITLARLRGKWRVLEVGNVYP